MIKKIYKNFKEEIFYHNQKKWTLTDVGNFWDKQKDYDDINSKIYPYLKRFTNSKKILDLSINKEWAPKNCLDIQTRTGKGSIFWSNIYSDCKFYGCDFSKNFLKKSKKNFINNKLKYESHLIKSFPLLFEDNFFDFVITYETIEHIYDYQTFLKEIARVAKPKAKIILTCPNTSWNWIHSLTAVIGINHSEGPHKFLNTKIIEKYLRENYLDILNYNTTICIPFNNKFFIKIDEFLEKIIPNYIKKYIFLRHTYILEKK